MQTANSLPYPIEPIIQLAREVILSFAPPPKLSISEWAEARRVLPAETSEESGKWRNVPFQVGFMDAILEPAVSKVTMMCSAQVGKTETLLNVIGYFVDHDPKPIIFMLPTVELAEDMSKERITPTARDTPCLRDKLRVERTKDGSNTILKKSFPGGHLSLVGSNSAGQAASRSISIILADEVDRFAVSAISSSGVYEGDPLTLLVVRQKNRFFKKAIFTSTPTVKGESRIEKSWKNSDQRLFMLPCPECGHMQNLVWDQVKWAKDEKGNHSPDDVWYECVECGEPISEDSIKSNLKKGEWVKQKPSIKGHAGFHINEFYSPWSRWSDIVKDYLEKKDNLDQLRVWWNTTLGRTFALPTSMALDWRRLIEKAEDYKPGIVPLRGLVLFAGADVQGDRLEVTVRAWNREESWVVSHEVLFGVDENGDRTKTDSPEVWKSLSDLLDRQWLHANGSTMKISKLAIDCGHRSVLVKKFVRSRKARGVVAVRGSSIAHLSAINPPKKVDVNNRGKATARGVYVWNLGTEVIKEDLFGRLSLFKPTEDEIRAKGFPPRYIHLPRYHEQYFRGICSEKTEEVVNKRTRKVETRWVQTYHDNEPLDCLVYSEAAFKIAGGEHWSEAKWKELEAERQFFSTRTESASYRPRKRKRRNEEDFLD